MLTFLRKIRKSLVDTGSTRKYILYAVGEFALVVIGILIALQINNWNERRKDRIEEKQILKAISKDMSRILDYCRVCGDSHREVLNSAGSLLNVIHRNEIIIVPDQIDHDLSALFKRCFVGEGVSQNIYDVLMGSDQLELLSSKELRDELAYLDSWIGTLQPYDILQAEFVDNQLKPFVNQYVDRTRLNIDAPSYNAIFDTTSFEKRFISQYTELIAQREFANLLADLVIHTNGVTGLYGFIDNSVRTIDSILIAEMPDLRPLILARSKR